MPAPIQTPVIQFGTSRFLQAHADLFIDEAMAQGKAAGAITIVQSSGDAARQGRLKALCADEGYPVRIRGIEKGRRIDHELRVRSVRRTLSTSEDWEAVVSIFVEQATYVLSNTGDAGYAPQPADKGDTFDQSMSYPAKLHLLLRARFEAHANPLTIMPLELIQRNGQVLKARILELVGEKDHAFRQWLLEAVLWTDSLVDRIVSEPIEPAGAIAEPYALWAIERQTGLTSPCEHPCVQMVDDLEEIESLKLFILNLGHTFLVSHWQKQVEPAQTVSAFLDDPSFKSELSDVLENEVLPGFVAAGLGDEAERYIATTIERFQNPFLQHRLADIAQNHQQKIERRIAGFISWAHKNGDRSAKPHLQAICDGITEETQKG